MPRHTVQLSPTTYELLRICRGISLSQMTGGAINDVLQDALTNWLRDRSEEAWSNWMTSRLCQWLDTHGELPDPNRVGTDHNACVERELALFLDEHPSVQESALLRKRRPK